MSEPQELQKLMESLTKAYEVVGEIVGETVRKALGGLEREPASVPEEPVFEYRDAEGDRLILGKNQHGAMVVQLVEDMPVHLDQDAVNRLARYLDRHRTDLPCPTRFHDTDCAGMRGHDGPCYEPADNIGVPPLCVCGHAMHAGACRQPGLSSPDCPCTTARYAG